MAQNENILTRLGKLFQSNIIVRKTDSGQLKVKDVDFGQSTSLVNNFVDRYNRLIHGNPKQMGWAGKENQRNAYEVARNQLFRDYELMDADPIISSALDIYSDECVGPDTIIPLLNGERVSIKELYDRNETDFWVYSLDTNTGNFIPAKCEKVANNGKKMMYKITLDDDTIIEATGKHLWVLPNGTLTKTSDLVEGGKIKALDTKISNKKLDGYEMIKHNGKFEFLHRLVAKFTPSLVEQRKTKSKFAVIHHSMFDKRNNSPEHLEWVEPDEHFKIHAKFNKELWSDGSMIHEYKEKTREGHRKYWTDEKRREVGIRQSTYNKKYLSNLTVEERRQLVGRPGKLNGMYGNGYKITGNKNGRWRDDVNRACDIDIETYINFIKSNHTVSDACIEFNLMREDVLLLNKKCCEIFNIMSIKNIRTHDITVDKIRQVTNDILMENGSVIKKFKKVCNRLNLKTTEVRGVLRKNGYNNFTEFVNSNNHIISKIEKIGMVNSYDLVNVGENHIYAIESNDGAKIYCHNSTIDNIEGQILKIKTDNTKVHDILHNLFYDIINIEFNLWSWMRNLTKYGDFFLSLDIVDKYGIVNVKPLSSYGVFRLEDHDPENPKLVQFEIEEGGNKEVKENYEVAHFRLVSDSNFLPYGKSMLEGARRVFKQLTLMEDAMLIHRIMRAPEKRIFKVDIGNIPPNEVENFMNKIIGKMKKIPVIDQATGDYNLRYNVESTTEDYYLPVRGSDSGTAIETLQGLTNEGAIDDIEYLRNKLHAALKVPKAFLGYEENVGSKATLAAEDVRFARTIERLQKIVVAELSKIAIVHLYSQGFEDAELINFDLELQNPSMIHEQEKLELLSQQVDIANSLIENKLLSREWIYDNIFEFNQGDKEKVFDGIIEDRKQNFRFEQIETEGNDPAESGEKAGDDEDLEMARKGSWGGDRRKGTGEKEYGNEYGLDDIKDATKYERERWGKREFKGKSPLATSKGSTLVTREGLLSQLKQRFSKNVKNKSILSEENIIEEETSE